MSWFEVCTPKHEGGLGLRNINDANKVSCLKLIWRLLSAESLWTIWVETYIIRGGSFWAVKTNPSKGSWMMLTLLKQRTEAKKFHRLQIGNGRRASFWYDSWMAIGRTIDHTGERGAIDLGIPLNATVQQASLKQRRRTYRGDNLRRIVDAAKLTFDKLNDEARDKDEWRFDETNFKNIFNSKRTWDQVRTHSAQALWSKGIWFQHSTPKFSFLCWLAATKRLSTGDNIQKWGSHAQISCCLCGCILESRNHLYIICSYSGIIWREIVGNLAPNTFSQDWNTVLQLLINGVQSKTKTFLIRYAFQTTVYHIWRERNSRRHGTAPAPHSLLIKLIDKNIRNRINSIATSDGEIRRKGLEKWFRSRRVL